jgi:hypothetical protein
MNSFCEFLFCFVLSMWKLTLYYSIHKNVLLHALHCENRSPKQSIVRIEAPNKMMIQRIVNFTRKFRYGSMASLMDHEWWHGMVAMLDDVMRTMEHEHAWMLGPVSVFFFFFSFLWWGMGGNHPIRDLARVAMIPP